MLRQLLPAGLVAVTAFPAAAQAPTPDRFAGFRVEAIAGWDNDRIGSGAAFGGALGYDRRVGRRVLLGVEGEATDSSIHYCRDYPSFGFRQCQDFGRDLYLGGRIGLQLSDTLMLYGKAGYANGRINLRIYDSSGSGAGHVDMDGFRLGAGLERAIGRNMVVKAEYRYSYYELGVERHQVVGGLGFRF